MGINKHLDSYDSSMQHIGNLEILNDFFMSVFINDLYHVEPKTFVIEGVIATMQLA